ncbi:MAG TPA: tRNA (adenosine(37)-N6)-dimethylallyltransferase MiaA, partial [Clostridiales bacterium]|nr:tRNA (adenosine(37)-N6)-dimethylallyltransferase MiaA [Clostridiales bacterium]
MNQLEKPDFHPDLPVLVIAGPTASGKTETALLVCEAIGGEIVSADSMQIYRGMDIGTAKATWDEQKRVPHHLIDIRNPGERYSVADYKRDATAAIRDIYARNRRPVVCGGTGQYLSALIEGLSFSDDALDLNLRIELNRQADLTGLSALYTRLQQVDPVSAARLAPADRKRIIRALEVFEKTGLTINQQNEQSRLNGPDFSFEIFGLSHDRPLLYERINRRVESMVSAGLADEVRQLLAQGTSQDSTCLQAIGYKEMLPFCRGEINLADAIASIQQATRRYAKRQMTW